MPVLPDIVGEEFPGDLVYIVIRQSGCQFARYGIDFKSRLLKLAKIVE